MPVPVDRPMRKPFDQRGRGRLEMGRMGATRVRRCTSTPANPDRVATWVDKPSWSFPPRSYRERFEMHRRRERDRELRAAGRHRRSDQWLRAACFVGFERSRS